MKTIYRTLIALALAFVAHGASAQTYPNRPIKLIVPFSAGGTTDAVARTLAHYLGQLTSQSVVVENKGGGGTIIGTEVLARSKADGYTLMLASPDFTVNPGLRDKLPYDTRKDFAPVALIGTYPMLLVTKTGSGLDSVPEIIADARQHPDQLTFASAGTGSMPHLCAELLKSLAHVKIMHVPFKGNGPAIAELLAGRVSMLFTGALPVEGLVKSGKLKVIGVTGKHRHPSLPAVPTLAESGVPGYEVTAWFGVIAPAGVPDDILKRLNNDINQVLKMPEVRKKLANLGADLAAGTPEDFGKRIDAEITNWGKLVKTAGIQAY